MSVTRNKKRKNDSTDNDVTTSNKRRKITIPESPVPSDDELTVTTAHIDDKENETTENISPKPTFVPPTIHLPEDLSSKHIDFLSINEHMRFLDNSSKVGHAVI